MSREELGSKDAVVTASILVASVVGVFAAWLPWHSLVGSVVEVRGIDRTEGQVLIGALGLAALLAAYHLVARGPLFARMLALATAVALGAQGTYLYLMIRPEGRLHDMARDALGGQFRVGTLIVTLATVSAFALSIESWRAAKK